MAEKRRETAEEATRPDESRRPGRKMEEDVAAKEERKLKARREKHRSIWFGLGMFGLIGWSVAVPALIGTAIGWWIDRLWPSPYSWTLTGLIVGVVVGCLNAWNWIQREMRD